MKIITAMVQPFMLSRITGALEEIDDFFVWASSSEGVR